MPVANGGHRPDDELPLVSVVMPVRNEAGFIADGLDAILGQQYPTDRLEVLVVDGRSTDDTRAIVREYEQRDHRVRLVDNPDGIVSTALNVGFAEARGDVLVRVDGHCRIAPDFIRQDVALLDEHPEAWSVGGPIVHRGRGRFGRAAAFAMSHRIGVGGARHRQEDFEGYAEGAVFPALRPWVFDRVGWFDEELVRNQDDEFNFRIAKAGGRIWISPKVQHEYYVRERPGQLARQYFQYSFWRVPILRKHRQPTTARQLVPPLFFLTMAATTIVGIRRRSAAVALGLPVAYAAVLGGVGVEAATKGVPPAVAVLVPAAIGIMHTSYAAGWIWGGAQLLTHRQAWSTRGAMSSISR